MYDRWRYFRYIPDLRSLRLIWRVWRHDGRPQAILQALVSEMASAPVRSSASSAGRATR